MASIAFTTRTIAARPSDRIRNAFRRVVDIVAERRSIARTRYALRGLSDHELKDIGIARSEINRIAREQARKA